MTEPKLKHSKLIEDLQINRGLSLNERIEECFVNNYSLREDYLIVHIDIGLNSVFLINLDSTPRFPIRVNYDDVLTAIENDKLEIIDIGWPNKALMSFEDLSEREQEKATKRYNVIKPLLIDLNATLMNGYGEGKFKSVINSSGCSKQYVYDCFLGFLYYGQRASALCLPIGKNIFHLPKEKRQINVKLGRISEDTNAGKVLDDYDEQCFLKAARKYFKRDGVSLGKSFELMLSDHYFESRIKNTLEEKRSSGEAYRVKLKPDDQRPTFPQFYYWFRKKYGSRLGRLQKSRKNAVEFKKDFAGRTGNAFATVIAFGQYFELDETPFDEELVSIFDPSRRTKIGKATLYFVIDRFSKYIVGVFITTENPSYKTVRQALFICGIEKTEFIARYGLDPNTIDWQYFGISLSLFVDNAEFRNRISEGAICDLQCTVKFARPGQGDDKPNVEKLFDIFREYFVGLSKGQQSKSLTDIHNQLARKHASLTVNELYLIAIVYINYHNNYRRIKNYSFDRAMIQDNVEPIPAKIVEWSLKNRPGYTIHYPKDELYLKLLPKGQVSVGRRGVYFSEAGLRYNCEWTLAEGYQDRKSNRNKVVKFDCRYNENFVDIILICTENGLKVATLDSSCDAYSGLSLHEVKLQKKSEKRQEATSEQQQLEYKLGLMDFMRGIIQNSQKERQTAPVPNISTIKDNRQLEAMVNRFSDTNDLLQALNQSAAVNFNEENDADDESDAEDIDENKTRNAFYGKR